MLRGTGSLWLGSFIVWATILLVKRVPSLLGPVLAFWAIPIVFKTPLAPGWLLTAVESPDHNAGPAQAFSLAVVVACLVALERHLVLRRVD